MKAEVLKKFDSLMSHLNSEENGMAEKFREKLEGLFETKTVYVLVSNGGDGSYYPNFTMNDEFIQKLSDKDERGDMDCESLGCDGDGFHYDTLRVPAFCTLESLTVSDCAYDIEDEELDV